MGAHQQGSYVITSIWPPQNLASQEWHKLAVVKHQGCIKTGLQCISVCKMPISLQSWENPQVLEMCLNRAWGQHMLKDGIGIWQGEWALASTIHPSSFPTGCAGDTVSYIISRQYSTSSP